MHQKITPRIFWKGSKMSFWILASPATHHFSTKTFVSVLEMFGPPVTKVKATKNCELQKIIVILQIKGRSIEIATDGKWPWRYIEEDWSRFLMFWSWCNYITTPWLIRSNWKMLVIFLKPNQTWQTLQINSWKIQELSKKLSRLSDNLHHCLLIIVHLINLHRVQIFLNESFNTSIFDQS